MTIEQALVLFRDAFANFSKARPTGCAPIEWHKLVEAHDVLTTAIGETLPSLFAKDVAESIEQANRLNAALRDDLEGERRGRQAALRDLSAAISKLAELQRPVRMRLECPACGELHIDEGAFATKPHHTHECQTCGQIWRPAIPETVGVRFLFGGPK
jgi:predicted RNA-binding Zn-ribbon protein involved in translation (DUF1610 family)